MPLDKINSPIVALARGIRVGRVYLIWFIAVLIITGMSLVGGCSLDRLMDSVSLVNPESGKPLTMREEEDLYEKFHKVVIDSGKVRSVSGGPQAFRNLPRDAFGEVNWTTSVRDGFLAPKGSLDPNAVEDTPLNLNIFIEAKVPMMANVIFPHSIHTYWLSCSNCHPDIFIPEAGANPITMDEIWQGKWCGRCHGKVAFNFWPEANCRRCHMVPKKMSGHKENY
ncbi:MAG: hypothetical protein HW415_953 [Deltaproteobacteria bacterium]|nr:hypothetical protein [Deltaproteobacteria bacterium]